MKHSVHPFGSQIKIKEWNKREKYEIEKSNY